MVEQGDILKMEGINHSALVISKNLYNTSGHVIVCPIISDDTASTLSYPIGSGMYVQCDNLRHLDISKRRYSVKDRIPLIHMINIIDRVQSLFDYY
jgi:mRNA-degrading endonuclease toxin of MazEF toxin-antitoxin module